jgi:hypothetical protein
MRIDCALPVDPLRSTDARAAGNSPRLRISCSRDESEVPGYPAALQAIRPSRLEQHGSQQKKAGQRRHTASLSA